MVAVGSIRPNRVQQRAIDTTQGPVQTSMSQRKCGFTHCNHP